MLGTLCIGMLNRSPQETQVSDWDYNYESSEASIFVHSLSRLLYIKVPDIQFSGTVWRWTKAWTEMAAAGIEGVCLETEKYVA